jgi:hypothetical protein
MAGLPFETATFIANADDARSPSALVATTALITKPNAAPAKPPEEG